MEERFPAHIRPHTAGTSPEDAIQSVQAHCENTARYAAQSLSELGLRSSGYLAGLIHDCGKFTDAFRQSLTKAAQGEEVKRGSVNHTFAAVRLLLQRYFKGDGSFSDVACEALAIAVGSHHGLFDCVDEQRKSGFQHRLTKKNVPSEEAIENFLRHCASAEKLDQCFQAAAAELETTLNQILQMSEAIADSVQYDSETAFYAGLLVRLLLSAVVEGDRRDTAEFMGVAPVRPDQAPVCWEKYLQRTEEKLSALPCETAIDQARREISNRCRARAEEAGGLFRLHAPTGGGKTLSSLRYALAHAAHYRKRRIIFVSPLLTILDQNARIIREYIGDDGIILEHHSNLAKEELTSEELDSRELLMESWESPVIITTLVQFLNTLFSGKMSAVRRFHALCNSVIVIDEVQTVPQHMLSLFSLAMNFLTEICHATVVLCSATQPCLEQTEHPLHGPIRDLLPYDPQLWQAFQRTEIQDAGSAALPEIALFAREILAEADSVLIICNKKAQARELFALFQDLEGQCFYLTADLCPQHRKQTLHALYEALHQPDGNKILCIATNVIEAGVDISFQRVIRFSAGMDSVVQAAGRCNRNNESEGEQPAPVYLVQCLGETLGSLPDIQKGKAATLDLLVNWKSHPAAFAHDLASDPSIAYYYRTLYRSMDQYAQDYPLKNHPTLFSLLSLNESCATEEFCQTQPYYHRQAFRLAGSLFQVFSQDTTDIIVPYEDGQGLIVELNGAHAANNPAYAKALLEKAKPFSVGLWPQQLQQLQSQHALLQLAGGAWGLVGHYDMQMGVTMEDTVPMAFLDI